MTAQPPGDTTDAGTVEAITDPESLRGRDGVAFHEDADTVDEEAFAFVDDADDMAPVGITNDDGAVLLMRVDEDCSRKIPSVEVGPGEEYGRAAREWVEEQAGIDVELDAVEAVWRYEARLEGEERAATRYFVVFGATPASGEGTALADTHEAEAVEWFEELPDDAVEVPGTWLFVD